VDPLIRTFLASLARGEPSEAALAALGEPEPAKAAGAIARAAAHPDLQADREAWLEPLLLSARPGHAAATLEEVANRYRDTRRRALPIGRMPALVRVLGSSDVLARLLRAHPHWAEELIGDPPAPPDTAEVEPDWTALRIAKYKGLLRIAGRDLLGRPFRDSPRELAALADACLEAGLERAARELGAPLPSLLALGKLGGGELNFSSDVDLLFVDPGALGALGAEHQQRCIALVQLFKRHMEVPSEDGFAYRIDLDLRPAGKQGPLVQTVDAALEYYESFGREWERQALIRLRRVAGAAEPARELLRQLQPFVYRRLIDPQDIRAIHAMKRRIESERRAAGRDLESNLKEGPGGIRDVEFLTQALQLFHGGRHPELRTGNVIDALDALERLHLVPAPVSEALRSAYLWLRRAEHALQMVEERQTQRFPREPAAQLALARRMGYGDGDARRALRRLLEDRDRVHGEVRQHFEALVLESRFESRTRSNRALEELLAGPLRGTPLFPRLSTSASVFLERRATDEVIARLDRRSLPGLARAITSNPEAARYLSVRPALLERIAEADPATLERRAQELPQALPPDPAADLEGFLDEMRWLRRDERLLAACLQFAGLADFEAVSSFLSSLAETCVRGALRAASPSAEPPVSVLGMGKIAGREFTYFSDLDLIFLYADGASDPAAAARVAQRLIQYLTTNTAAGSAYAVDSRLRPSGRQGALVTSFDAFRRYQLGEAATWEHVALMRSRAIAGREPQAQAVLDAARGEIAQRRASPWEAIGDIRRRVERERAETGTDVLAFKTGRGGLMEIDFLGAGGLLERGLQLGGEALPAVPAMLRAVAPGERSEALIGAYAWLRRLEACARWIAGRAVEHVRLASETAGMVAELVEPGQSLDALARRTRDAQSRVRDAYESVLAARSIDALS
jgi:glutamate-ammonia-ligase adenylyltransferase